MSSPPFLLFLLCCLFPLLPLFSFFFLLLLPFTSPPVPLMSSWVVANRVDGDGIVSLHTHKLFLHIAALLQMGNILRLFFDQWVSFLVDSPHYSSSLTTATTNTRPPLLPGELFACGGRILVCTQSRVAENSPNLHHHQCLDVVANGTDDKNSLH